MDNKKTNIDDTLISELKMQIDKLKNKVSIEESIILDSTKLVADSNKELTKLEAKLEELIKLAKDKEFALNKKPPSGIKVSSDIKTGFFDSSGGFEFAYMPEDKSYVILNSGREQFGSFSRTTIKRMNEFSNKHNLPFYVIWVGRPENQTIYVMHSGEKIYFNNETLRIDFKTK